MSARIDVNGTVRKIKENNFLFSELVKRDFKKKYKRTYLGVVWSLFSPLLTLFVMRLIFTEFFGKNIEHYTTYLFCGNIVFNFFSDATNGTMGALINNADIFSKINVPKYLFLLSRSVASLINFALTFVVFLFFCLLDGIVFTWGAFSLIYPIFCIVVFNIGVGLILSALYVFFRDIQYLWSVFTMLVMYVSAIFYDVNTFSPSAQRLFLINPVYVYIKYFRTVVLDGAIPSAKLHFFAFLYALFAFLIGAFIYKRKNNRFLYYI